MREGIHPTYQHVTVTCACGKSWVTGSTAKEIRLEICSNCHPFYTGRQKLMDTAGRVERFEKRFASTGGKTVVRKPVVKKAAPAVKAAAKKAVKVLSSTPLPGLKEKTGKPVKSVKGPKTDKAPAKKA
ncbi:MAG: 50S ribosomal protein L31 [Elusimicrobia bacterium]|nr:50S ribosomal protein L31 [Elusimicrobiota bacterium]